MKIYILVNLDLNFAIFSLDILYRSARPLCPIATMRGEKNKPFNIVCGALESIALPR